MEKDNYQDREKARRAMEKRLMDYVPPIQAFYATANDILGSYNPRKGRKFNSTKIELSILEQWHKH